MKTLIGLMALSLLRSSQILQEFGRLGRLDFCSIGLGVGEESGMTPRFLLDAIRKLCFHLQREGRDLQHIVGRKIT